MSDYITEFLDAKAVEEGAALNTLQAYRNDISQFVAAISPVAVTEVKTEDIEKYLKSLKDAGNLPKTLSRKISCIREFFKFLQSEKIVADSPANKLRTPKIGKSLPLFLTAKEVKKLCSAAKLGKRFSLMRMGVMVKLMYSSGLRVSELVSLPENAINYDMRQILICGKGSKERIVPVTKEVIDEVFENLEYRNKYKGRPKLAGSVASFCFRPYNKRWLFQKFEKTCGKSRDFSGKGSPARFAALFCHQAGK